MRHNDPIRRCSAGGCSEGPWPRRTADTDRERVTSGYHGMQSERSPTQGRIDSVYVWPGDLLAVMNGHIRAVAEVTGRPPRDVSQFARDYAPAFAS